MGKVWCSHKVQGLLLQRRPFLRIYAEVAPRLWFGDGGDEGLGESKGEWFQRRGGQSRSRA